MASRNASIAEAVAVALTAAAAEPARFGATFAARRVYSPVLPLEAPADWTCTVYAPGDTTDGMLDRSRWQLEVPVLVGVERRLPRSVDPKDPEGNATLDEYTEVAERVAAFFVPGFRAAGGTLKRTELRLQTPEVARGQRRFFAVASLFFFSTT